jgi:hypothetical protein
LIKLYFHIDPTTLSDEEYAHTYAQLKWLGKEKLLGLNAKGNG